MHLAVQVAFLLPLAPPLLKEKLRSLHSQGLHYFGLHQGILRCAYHPHENTPNLGDALNVILASINSQRLSAQLEKLP